MARGEPLLMRSGLTNRVYVVTAYKDLGNGQIEATKKHDVTEQFDALVAQELDVLEKVGIGCAKCGLQLKRDSGPVAVTQKGKTQ